MKVLFTFPGQGAQVPGMLQQLPDLPAVQHTLEEASSTLARDVLQLDGARELQSTVAVQLCLLIAGVASARLLSAQAGPPDMVAGLSIGAFAAAVTAGVLSFHDALLLVEQRALLMQQAYPTGYGMSAVSGLNEEQLEARLQPLRHAGLPVYIANLNAEQQLVVAGSTTALQHLEQNIQASGNGHCRRLAISVPSHCPLLNEAAECLRQRFSSLTLHAPRCAFLSTNQARMLWQTDQLQDDLAHNMSRQVHWHAATRLAYERGIRLVIEMRPGNTLTRLARPVFLDGEALAMADTRLDTIITLIQRVAKAG